MRLLAAFSALLLAPVLALGACAHREIPFATLEAKYGLTQSRHVEPEPGLSVHYVDEGARDRPALVMIHGFAASLHAWRPWADRLRDDYRIVSLDLPGHGLTQSPPGYKASLDSDVALVDQFADTLHLKRFVIVGNSMGGAIAWRYAMLHPDRLDGLVLVNAAGWPGDKSQGGPPGFVALLNNPLGRGIIKMFDPRSFARGGLKSAYLDPALVNDALVDRYAELALAPGHRDVLLTQNPQPAEKVTAADFAKIRTPTLVLSGGMDKLIPPADQRAFAQAIPGARLVVYPDGGHVPMEQLPDASAKDLRAFLASLER